MEVKEKSKKRELIKTIAIVFLAVLLVLTFFSNTIMNYSLPEVATQSITSGTINARIRGSGAVTAAESYQVVMKQTRQIRTVCVSVGDTVQQGDLLFVLEDMESQELKDAQEQLQMLELNYEKQLLSLSLEYASEDQNLKILREDLAKATAQRDANLVTESEITFAKGDLTAAKGELARINQMLSELTELKNQNDAYTTAKAEVDKWTETRDAALDKMEDLREKIAQAGSGSGTDLSALQAQLQSAREAAAAAEAEVTAAQSAMTDAQSIYQSSYDALKAEAQKQMMAAGKDITNAADLDYYMQSTAVTSGNSSWQEAYTVFGQCRAAVAAAESKLAAANAVVTDCAERIAGYTGDQSLITTLNQQYNTASADYANAQAQLQQANYALLQAENSNTALNTQIEGYEKAKKETDAEIELLTQAIAEMENRKVAYDTAVAIIAEKERAIENALVGKDIGHKLDNLDLESARLQIEKQQELVDKYKGEAVEAEITASISGTISSISVSAGKEVAAGTTMAVIDVVDRGYTLRVNVTNEQARQVKVGDTAEVNNYYWGNDLTARLESIAPNPDNPGQGKTLIFKITGQVDPGTNLTLSIGQRSASFDTIIPKSALRQDTNGSFVLVVMAKSSPLGNRYTAARVDVQVLAEDDTSAAVSGLSGGDYVITTSSKPLEAGSQVRMVENP